MPKCLISGEDIGPGTVVLVLSRHQSAGDTGLVTLDALRKAYALAISAEKQIADLKKGLGG